MRSSAERLKPGEPGYVHPVHRNTITDKRMKKRRERALAREMKEKEKEYKAYKSVWNVDSTKCVDMDVSIKYVDRIWDMTLNKILSLILQCHCIGNMV